MDGPRPAAAPGSRDELVRRAAGGDVAAYARLIRLHHEAMTRAALVVTGDLDRAAAATEAALLDAWLALRHPRTPTDTGAWLGSRAVVEAVRLAPGDAGPAIDPALGRLATEDRATLTLHHVAALAAHEIAMVLHRPWARVVDLLDADPDDATGSRVRAVSGIAVSPIDADAVARRARAEEVLERHRVISVAVSAVVGFLVVVHPYLFGILLRR
jgi:DNA-directed RNA polymerase specialized sigma24 family protein